MAGMRVGTLYTQNQDLVEALDQMGAFHGVPGPIQHQVAQLLQDRGVNTHTLDTYIFTHTHTHTQTVIL